VRPALFETKQIIPRWIRQRSFSQTMQAKERIARWPVAATNLPKKFNF